MSALALVAVLWAMVSIGRHIYTARRRARFLRDRRPQSWAEPVPTPSPQIPAGNAAPTAAEFSFAELAMKSFSAPQVPAPTPVDVPLKASSVASPALAPASAPMSSAGRAVAPQSVSVGALGLIAAARKLSQDMPLPQVRPSGSRPAFDPSAMSRQIPPAPLQTSLAPSAEVVTQLPAIETFLPPLPALPLIEPTATAFTKLASNSLDLPPRKQPQPAESAAAKTPEVPAVQSDPFLRRPVRSVHPPHPAPPFALPLRRPDWVYFNKDMGDLSDPTPSRIRDRVRSR
jgi:hypothetical protein